MEISKEAHRRGLERATAAAVSPAAGLYGPRSRMWRYMRESLVFVGGGRAALLQAAHPFVAHAVADHSKTKTDLPGRFQRTFLNVFDMVFGDLPNALKSARRVYGVHTRIHGALPEAVGAFPAGTRYFAHHAGSVLWVHATLIDTAVMVYERAFGRLPPAEIAALYEESKRFAWLFGLEEGQIPRDWAEFRTYMQDMLASDEIKVGAAAADICHFLLLPPNAAVKPLWDVYSLLTAGLLPERLRREYGMPFGRLERALFETTLQGIVTAYRAVPGRLRYLPAYTDAERRLAGKRGPDLYGQLVQRVVLASLRQTRAA